MCIFYKLVYMILYSTGILNVVANGILKKKEVEKEKYEGELTKSHVFGVNAVPFW